MNEVLRVDNELSLQFYNFLCNIIGTEDVVRARRILLATRDYFADSNDITIITSGSKAEGLDMRKSDIDIMVLFNQFNILENISDDNNVKPYTFVMETGDTKPGFTQLKLCGFMSSIDKKRFCLSRGQEFFFSNELAKTWMMSILAVHATVELTTIHGPCISDTDEEYDFAFCLRCSTWIHQAHQWATRNRVWPSAELDSNIINYGLLFVPLGSKNSPNEEIEWRISFSVVEKHLIFSFSHTQLLCYALLKILLKEIIETDTRLKGLLCSYFLKTILFWVSEEMPLSAWQPDNIIPCFMNCFRRFVYCVNYSILPHYFITDNNLFEDRFSTKEGIHLITLLNDLYQNGPICLMHSESLFDFFQNNNVNVKLPIRSKCDSVVEQICAIRISFLSIRNSINENVCCLNKLINIAKHYRKAKNVFAYRTMFFRICQIFVKTYAMTALPVYANKVHYQTHKKCLAYLISGLRTDAVSGWLYLATYFYCSNRFTLSLQIIDYALNKCTSDKIYCVSRGLTTQILHVVEKAAIDSRKLDLSFIYRRHMIHDMTYTYRTGLLPHELRTEVALRQNYAYKPPIVYAHFLKFLCFYKLYDVNNCRRSIDALRRAVDESSYYGIVKAQQSRAAVLE